LLKAPSEDDDSDCMGTGMSKTVIAFFISFYLASGLVMAVEYPVLAQETDPEAFKLLKEKSIDPQTGLPKTLDPNLFRGKAKQAYQIAKEIPEVLAQMPCFCECEAYGHENLLDCFIDRHGAG
jgi:hypothetical protein